jgi:hypothetical protein
MKPVLAVVTLLICGVPVHGQVQPPPAGAGSHHHGDEAKAAAGAAVPASLVGRWRSASFELELASDLHRSVYGPKARSVRTVDVVIRPSGEGTFTVTNLVRNGRGLAVPGTRSVEELTFTLGARDTAPGDRTRYATKVVRAERRYLDAPTSSFPLEGASLEVYPPSESKGPLEVRYDTPEGTGSFWETLRPATAGAPGRAAPAQSPR